MAYCVDFGNALEWESLRVVFRKRIELNAFLLHFVKASALVGTNRISKGKIKARERCSISKTS